MRHPCDSPLAVDRVLHDLAPKGPVWAPARLERNVYHAVVLDRATHWWIPLRHLSLAFVACTVVLAGAAYGLWTDGTLASWVGALYGRMVVLLVAPTPDVLVYVGCTVVAVTSLVTALTLQLVLWANTGLLVGRLRVTSR